ncbi:MAG: peptidoglycan DD-metalloendopeptidase family protein [Bacteroides sp.]|nr:peptidoglycan DD-metalloendopeptidase family protein [Ruminococcus flavefaciens]MCM1554952.1 peptidoglycan DD-metalloendopeptidase family protein [Bacteroides sp.]
MRAIARKYLPFLCMLLLAASFSHAPAQDRKTLEANKKKLEQEIAQTNKQLSKTSKQKKATVAELQLVNSNINKRQQLIKGLNQEVTLTEREIGRLQSKINRLSTDIENLKKEYAKLLTMAKRHRNQYSLLMFIFSSDNFNQAWRRIRYISQYDDYLKKQVAIITEKQQVLASSRKTLETERNSKQQLVASQVKAKKELEKEQKSKNQMVAQLKKQEKTLRNKLQTQQKKVNQLNDQIKKKIEAEIRASRQKDTQKKPAGANTSFALTPEEKTLSSNFESNKGILPWPLERGTISGHFGTHPHPVISSLTVTNNGIDILTEKGACARAVFKGEVCNIESAYGLKFVMVRHGAYMTVYANLDQVYVKKGQTVNVKDKIGRVYYDADENKTELQFQVWKNTTKLNPESWIAR